MMQKQLVIYNQKALTNWTPHREPTGYFDLYLFYTTYILPGFTIQVLLKLQ